MLSKISEQSLHKIRWLLTCEWLLLIFSLFYDPISANLFNSLPISSNLVETASCIKVQGVCLTQNPYPMGNSIFWGLVIPFCIFTLFIFGHEFWRQICPLSFLSQLPRLLGKQRRLTKIDPKTGQKRSELVRIKPNSWLGQNHLFLQFGFLYIGVCSRILFLDAHRLKFLKTEQLLELAYQTYLKIYNFWETILEIGCLEQKLYILVEGEIKQEKQNGQFHEKIFRPIQILNKVEILAQTPQKTNLIAMISETKILTLDHQCLEVMFTQNKELTRKFITQLAQSKHY